MTGDSAMSFVSLLLEYNMQGPQTGCRAGNRARPGRAFTMNNILSTGLLHQNRSLYPLCIKYSTKRQSLMPSDAEIHPILSGVLHDCTSILELFTDIQGPQTRYVKHS